MFAREHEVNEASLEAIQGLPEKDRISALIRYKSEKVFKLQVDLLVWNMAMNVLMAKTVNSDLDSFCTLVKKSMPEYSDEPGFKEIKNMLLSWAMDDADESDIVVPLSIFFERIQSLQTLATVH